MNLFYRELGEGEPLIILHGLFGSSDNWYSLSKVFAEHFHVYVIDQRNHGQSPHTEDIDYRLLADDLGDFIKQHNIKSPSVIGHSMGGKAAMNFAVKMPTVISKLVVVDMVPKAYPVHHDAILSGLQAIDLSKISSRGEADEQLKAFVPDAGVRQFLLKNLARDEHKNLEWRINIPVIAKNIEALGADIHYDEQFTHPTLFVMGSKSEYFAKGDEAIIEKYFPNASIIVLETGHWVQAEKPEEFAKTVMDFL
ncbi:MAG: alpha/beta fold hydrolase [Cyclobacteriaceae bacterium]